MVDPRWTHRNRITRYGGTLCGGKASASNPVSDSGRCWRTWRIAASQFGAGKALGGGVELLDNGSRCRPKVGCAGVQQLAPHQSARRVAMRTQRQVALRVRKRFSEGCSVAAKRSELTECKRLECGGGLGVPSQAPSGGIYLLAGLLVQPLPMPSAPRTTPLGSRALTPTSVGRPWRRRPCPLQGCLPPDS